VKKIEVLTGYSWPFSKLTAFLPSDIAFSSAKVTNLMLDACCECFDEAFLGEWPKFRF
jgi:hypothetical protein